MRPHDIELLTVPTSPAVRGELVLVSTTQPNLRDNAYRSGLRRIDSPASEPTPTGLAWTHGERDTAPAISPDGRWVAFLRATGGTGRAAQSQVYVMPAAGGEPRRLTDLPLGASAPVWAPDSRRIAFTARVPEAGRYGTAVDYPERYEEGDAEPTEPAAEAPRRITRVDYHVDDVGYLHDRPSQLYVLDAVAAIESHDGLPELVASTDENASVAEPAWTPDGRHIVVVAQRDWGQPETLYSDLYAIPADGGEPVLMVRTEGRASLPVVTKDGLVLYFGIAFTGIDSVGRNTGLWAAPVRLDGLGTNGMPAKPRRLTDPETVDCEPLSGPPVPHGDAVLVAVLDRGAVELRSVPISAERATLTELPSVIGGRCAVTGFDSDGSRIACVVATLESAGEVVLVDEQGSRTLTDFGAPLRASGICQTVELTGSAADGYPVHGWLVLPEGDGPHPVLLAVHGGPFRYYSWGLFDEAQVYAAAGYAVVLPNPRGSAGYGQAHGRAIVGAFGTVDVDDVLAMLDVALDRPDCDAERVGVMGGSYGGFLAGWLAAHHGERFRAAWSERSLNAWDSFTGSSDIGWYFTDAYCGSDPETQRAMSPLSYADQISMPFAVVHSEQDWRCPIEQGKRMFVALRRNGVEAEMLIFPGEGHELSRSGRPRHRVQRFDAVLEWWSRQLK
ncbi:MAG: alpha/beta fold hydrolase [Pseudonocardiaceae bacterium]|nr:alpha/beta fold hydrolase [Pseudonocardiaceae bacterium]